MYRLLYDGEEYLYNTLDDALNASKNIGVEWTILDPDGRVEFDWMDRVGP
jgi:phosphatidylserine/phosphatidylglycerophosphate/cardiolipin synthase-like enzyme